MQESPRRQQIEDAASALFRERGYTATSVRDIAQALNLQGGSLYAHMASKEDVLWSIVSKAADRFNDEVASLSAATTPPPQRLRDMIRGHVAVITSSQKDAAVFLHEWRFLSPARREQIAVRRDAYESLFRRAIADGVHTGYFQPLDAKLAAMAILGALNGIATWYRPDGVLSADEIADSFADLFINALREQHFMSRTIT